MFGALHAIGRVADIDAGWCRVVFRVRVPAADEVKTGPKPLLNLRSLTLYVRGVGIAGTAIVRPRPSRFGNHDGRKIEPNEK